MAVLAFLLGSVAGLSGCDGVVPRNQPQTQAKTPNAEVMRNRAWLAETCAVLQSTLEVYQSIKDVESARAAVPRMKELHAAEATLLRRRETLVPAAEDAELSRGNADVAALSMRVEAELARLKHLPEAAAALVAGLSDKVPSDPALVAAHREWAREMAALARENAAIFRTITDAASAQAAMPKLNAASSKFTALRAQMEELGMPPLGDADLDMLMAEFKAAGKECAIEIRRIDRLPEVERIVREASLAFEDEQRGGPSVLDLPFRERRKVATKLHTKGPSPQPGEEEPLPEHVSRVEYESDGRKLKAWLYRPPIKEGDAAARPALVYLHGGFAFGVEDIEDARPFLDAGFLVLYPSFRGENRNPGYFEMCYGEVDDAAAAVRWIAKLPEVDPKRVYVFGHSSGGIEASLLSLYEDLPIKHTGSVGGLYGIELFQRLEFAPFDSRDHTECDRRVLVGNLRWMKRPHHAYIGDQDYPMRTDSILREAKKFNAPLLVTTVPGGHGESKSPGVKAYLKLIQEEKE